MKRDKKNHIFRPPIFLYSSHILGYIWKVTVNSTSSKTATCILRDPIYNGKKVLFRSLNYHQSLTFISPPQSQVFCFPRLSNPFVLSPLVLTVVLYNVVVDPTCHGGFHMYVVFLLPPFPCVTPVMMPTTFLASTSAEDHCHPPHMATQAEVFPEGTVSGSSTASWPVVHNDREALATAVVCNDEEG
jgi:hypothetical protein